MLDVNYVRDYYDKHAAEWVAGAYEKDNIPRKYPIGYNRARITIKSILDKIDPTGKKLVDFACGGGELCINAATLGMEVTGIDISTGMIEEAKKKQHSLPEEIRNKLTFLVGNLFELDLAAKEHDVITALGIIEYLPEDPPFFEKAYNLLKPGGLFILSSRNQLFNMASLNDYTMKKLEDNSAIGILSEIVSLNAQNLTPEQMLDFIQELKIALPKLEEAIKLDLQEKADHAPEKKGLVGFGHKLRQHTPEELHNAAKLAGFKRLSIYGVHPHPFLPGSESLFPHLYNQLASVYEIFETTPYSLIISSAFITVLQKPE